MSKSPHPVPAAPAPSLAPCQLDILFDSIPTEKMSASQHAKAIARLANGAVASLESRGRLSTSG